MFKVGLTGGIGSGKSTVTDHFESLGISIVDADVIARNIVQPGSYCLEKITEHFGADILLENGHLDRKKLRSIIFDNKDEKSWLENLTHPMIRKDILAKLESSPGEYSILSAPLLIEGGYPQLLDRIVIIDIDEESQRKRTSQRDSTSPEEVQKIMDSQLARSERLKYADDIIDNNGSKSETEKQVEMLHEKYLALATK